VVADPQRTTGRVLMLDTLRHSYVDLADPTYLQFEYVRVVAAVIDALPDGPVSALHLGGGGLTVPRYLAAVRPGSDSLVLEVDPGVVAIDRDQLELETSDRLRVRVTDARVGLADRPAGERTLVVGDAFGGWSVPWQLTTVEALRLVDRALADDGLYVANLIDHPPMAFVRAELATLREVFPHVLLIARRPVLDGTDGGNVVVVASRGELPVAAFQEAMRAHEVGWVPATATALDAFVGDAPVLTDDHAPVDQLLTPYGS
jgi:spermidine synthase